MPWYPLLQQPHAQVRPHERTCFAVEAGLVLGNQVTATRVVQRAASSCCRRIHLIIIII